MFTLNRQLITPFDFDNAMFFGIPVSVYDGSIIVDYGGLIEKHTDDCVYINGGYYIKANFQFRIRRITNK